MMVMNFDLALAEVLRHASNISSPSTERVPLEASSGRVLAREIRADRDQPPFARSTRDGYAVRAEDISAGARIRLVGQVQAGELWRGPPLNSGETIEIMTGAPLPAGANAVLMVEHATLSENLLYPASGQALRSGENVVPQGAESKHGDLVLPPGSAMGAAEIALSATCGCSEVEVFLRPQVAIVSTGDELVELGLPLEVWQIRNSNSYALRAMVESAGAFGERLETARDLREQLQQRIAKARTYDMAVFSGGVSKGKYDLLEEMLEEAGAEFFFTGVKMQPGGPVVFGRLPGDAKASSPQGWCYFFGLPGNPVSTQVTFHCFVEPMLRLMCGENTASPRFVQASLAQDVPGKSGITRFLPAMLVSDRIRPHVRLVPWQGSGDLAANARANCYAVLPPEIEQFRAGDTITLLLR